MLPPSAEAINVDDIGVDLCVLACHLFARYDQANVALKELCLRCQCAPTRIDLASCTGIRTLHDTQWYTSMKQRFAEETQRVQLARKSDLTETEDLVRSLYPNGCSLSDYADAVQTCAAMLPFTIAGDAIGRFIEQEGATLSAQQHHALTVDDLLSGLVQRLIVPSLLPVRWWSTWHDNGTPTPYEATRIGLSVAPLRIAIEYRHNGSGVLATRTVPLVGHLSEHGPTAPLARRLAAVHGSIVTEAVLQKALITLQRLLQTRPTAEAIAPRTSLPAAPTSGAQDGAAHTEPASAPASSSSSAAEYSAPQKADLGLLYRDPDKALHNVDLNDADDMTVKEFKEAMDVKFSSNALRPGDEGYTYDRRVEFKPTVKSEWDDDSD